MINERSPGLIFGEVYRSGAWGRGSGSGSTPASTRWYRRKLEYLLKRYRIGSVVDVGCGDWAHSRLVDWGRAAYLGIDVVPGVIEANTRKFARPGVSFECVDALDEFPWPPGDLLICKDVLQHWPNESVLEFCTDAISTYDFTLMTNDISSPHLGPEFVNTNIAMGGWRTLDLEAPPFNFAPAWQFDYEIPHEETKRVYLFRHRAGAS